MVSWIITRGGSACFKPSGVSISYSGYLGGEGGTGEGGAKGGYMMVVFSSLWEVGILGFNALEGEMVKYASALASYRYISYICRNLGRVWLPFILTLVVRRRLRQNSIFLWNARGGEGGGPADTEML